MGHTVFINVEARWVKESKDNFAISQALKLLRQGKKTGQSESQFETHVAAEWVSICFLKDKLPVSMYI